MLAGGSNLGGDGEVAHRRDERPRRATVTAAVVELRRVALQLLRVVHHILDFINCYEGARAVVHGDVPTGVPGQLDQPGQTILDGPLPLLTRVSECELTTVTVNDGLVFWLVFRVHY